MESDELRREWYWCLYGALALGIVVRVSQFAQYNSLGLDESALAISIVTKSYGELFGPLGHGQIAPPLFLVLAKLSAQVFGVSEYAVRLPSVLTSIIGLFAFYAFARSCTDKRAAIIATAFFATSGHLIFYAYQCKPYANDVTVFIVVAWLSTWLHRQEHLSWRNVIIYGAAGAVCVWASYSSVFVMAGAGGALLIHALAKRNRERFGKIAVAVGMWLISFALLYFLHIRAITGHDTLMSNMNIFWKDGFMPLPPTSTQELAWFKERFLLFFWMPGGFRLTGLAGFSFLVGSYALWRQDRTLCGAVLLPIVVTLLVSGVHQYPFEGRMTLFLSPALFLMLGVGVSTIWTGMERHGIAVGSLMLLLLLAPPTARSVETAIAPRQTLDYADALEHVQDNWQEGDLLYVASPDQFIYHFCKDRAGFDESDVFIEPDFVSLEHKQQEFYAEQSDRFREHGRVWFPMVYEVRWAIEPYLGFLAEQGTLDDEYTTRGAGVFRYRFE